MKWILFGNSGAGSSASLPGQPIITLKGYRHLPGDSDGRAYIEVLGDVAPPDPAGTYGGANIWLQAPDSFGADDFSGGGLELGADEIGAVWAPLFVTWATKGEEFRFRVPAPDKPQYWRAYAVSGSEDKSRLPIERGKSGESPNVVFLVEPPPAAAIGREYAPVVEDVTAVVEYDLTGSESGAQRFRVKTNWAWPRRDEAIATVGGVDIALNDGDPATEDLQASMSIELDAAGGTYTTDWKDVPASPAQRRVEFYTYDTSGRRNSYQYGITPSVLLTIQRQSGGSGLEYAPAVTPNSPTFITCTPISITADGSAPLQVNTYWTAPADSRFGGVELVVERADGVRKPYGGGRLSPTEHFLPNPATVQTYRFWVVSRDTAGRINSIVPGVTPYQDISVGSTAGQLNLAKGINYNATRLRQNGGQFDLAPGGISTEYLATSGIDIGPGANKSPFLRIQDGLGALLAWIGDYSALGGYVGAWFKTFRFGGASPDSAPIRSDASGNTSIDGATFVFSQPGIITKINDQNYTEGTAGLVVHDGSSNNAVSVRPAAISLDASVSGGPRARLAGGQTNNGTLILYNTLNDETVRLAANSGIRVRSGATTKLLIDLDGIIQFTASRPAAAAGSQTVPGTCAGFIDIKVGANDFCIPYFTRA
jgi:hypothetical protein